VMCKGEQGRRGRKMEGVGVSLPGPVTLKPPMGRSLDSGVRKSISGVAVYRDELSLQYFDTVGWIF